MTSPKWYLAGWLGLAMLVMVGCKQEEQPPPQPDPESNSKKEPIVHQTKGKMPMLEEIEPHAAGKKVYNANRCVTCHALAGVSIGPPRGRPMPGKGPNLTKVASSPERDADWFIAFVSNPRKDKPNSRMPPFEKQIKPEDMRALAEFLASLK